MKQTLACLVALLVIAPALGAQTPSTPPGAQGATQNLRVFVDNCPCDTDYLRTEITFVEYMRDRADAQVHLLFASQSTGAGGQAYTIYVIGLKEFAGVSDTLVFTSEPAQTQDSTRKTLVRYVKLGLMRYVARTPIANRIQISLAGAAAGAAAATRNRDPWDFWVFRIGVGGYGDGEKTRKQFSSNASLSANRTTEQWKFRTSTNGSYNDSRFTFSDGRQSKNYSYSASASAMGVRSIGPHWSVGALASGTTGTFRNLDLAARAAPAVEYSVFPYSESTRRQLTLLYTVGVNVYDYKDSTFYNRTSEVRPDHTMMISYDFTQPWGSANASVSGQQYLHDPKLYGASAYGSANIRLFRGFQLSFFVEAATIYNQIYVQKRGATDEEILLNQRQQQTPYRFFGDVSLSYTFGSIFNSIVNPRFNSTPGTLF
jgi:hypothetical protein